MREHSSKRIHACTKCGASYKRISHLKRHIKMAHNVISNTRIVRKLNSTAPIDINGSQENNNQAFRSSKQSVFRESLLSKLEATPSNSKSSTGSSIFNIKENSNNQISTIESDLNSGVILSSNVIYLPSCIVLDVTTANVEGNTVMVLNPENSAANL